MKTMERQEISKGAGGPRPTARRIDPLKAGAALAGLSAISHAFWALLVAVGWAQPFMDFMFQLHFLQPLYFVGVFDFRLALLLVTCAAVGGFALGFIFAVLWNTLMQ